MNTQELQQELLATISDITIESDDSSIETMRERALEVINELREHINDDIEYNAHRMTALDCTIFFDTQGYGSRNSTRINNSALLELERAIKDTGGKTSEELGRNADRPSTRLENVTIEPVMRNARLVA
jgi:hypothetical protein